MEKTQDFTPFTAEQDEQAFRKIRENNELVGHIIEGDTYIAKTRSGKIVKLSLSITMRDYDALSGATTQDGIALMEKMAQRAHSKTSIQDLPIQTITALVDDYSKALDKSLGAGLGK